MGGQIFSRGILNVLIDRNKEARMTAISIEVDCLNNRDRPAGSWVHCRFNVETIYHA